MEKIAEIINDWDPIELFPMAPQNEYFNEIVKIHEYVSSQQNLHVQALAEMINKTFLDTFGPDVYNQNMEQCMIVAERIISRIGGNIA